MNKVSKLVFLALGYTYRLLYLLPVVGDRAVRGICRGMALMNYHSPFGIKSFTSMDTFFEQFQGLVDLSSLPIVVTGHDDERLDLVVNWCPYGFSRPGHRGVCDAAMDMDRAMFGYCGMELIIHERIPDGFPACRVSIHAPAPGTRRTPATRSRHAASSVTNSRSNGYNWYP